MKEVSKIRWYGHVKKMNAGRMPRNALEYQLEGKRSRGQSRHRWKEQVKKTVEKRGIKWMEMVEEETWNDRDRWGLLSKTQPPGNREHEII